MHKLLEYNLVKRCQQCGHLFSQKRQNCPYCNNEAATSLLPTMEDVDTEDDLIVAPATEEENRFLGIDRRKVLIGAICAVGVLLCIFLVTTIFGKKSSPQDVADSYIESTSKKNMVEDNDGEWKTKTSDEGNSGIQTSTITSDAEGETQYDWLSTRYVTYDDIKNMDKGQVRVLKNAIFARHGRRFKDPNLRAYFNSQSWYTPTCDEVPPHEFNEYENYNIKFLLKYEK